jgi:hypothetical protein
MYNYSIILKDGKVVNVKADRVSWDMENRNVSFLSREDAPHLVAVFNVDNIAGFVRTAYMTEGKDL